MIKTESSRYYDLVSNGPKLRAIIERADLTPKEKDTSISDLWAIIEVAVDRIHELGNPEISTQSHQTAENALHRIRRMISARIKDSRKVHLACEAIRHAEEMRKMPRDHSQLPISRPVGTETDGKSFDEILDSYI